MKPKVQKFMFFDDLPYEYMRGFVKKQGRPIRYENNPVLVPELPHEASRVQLYGTVSYDEENNIFKMWYPAFDMRGEKTKAVLCYARSKDGCTWEKPDLGVVPGTNMVLGPEHDVRGQSIIYDKDEKNPERRYKFLVRPGHINRICSYVSPDGIHWNMLSDSAIEADSDSHVGLLRHPVNGKYYSTMRKLKGDRRVWISESTDFENWTEPELVKEMDVNQSMQTQIYGMQMTYYGAYLIGLVSYYNTVEDDFDGWGKMDGTMDIGLAYARGPYCWHDAFINERFIDIAGEGNWDGQMIIPASHLVLLEDEIRIYYAGCDHTHKPPYPFEKKLSIGYASLRPDGFAYIEAGEDPAELMTRMFCIDEEGVSINADASEGEIHVEICDGEGKPIPGFEMGKCKTVRGDAKDLKVEWENRPDTDVLSGKMLRLRLKAVNSRIYSVTMTNGQQDCSYWEFREIAYANPQLYCKIVKES